MAIDKKSSHYDAGGIEAINVIQAKLTHEQFVGYLLGNVMKYSMRLNYKGTPLRDSEKTEIYAELLKKIIEHKENTDRVIEENQ